MAKLILTPSIRTPKTEANVWQSILLAKVVSADIPLDTTEAVIQ